MEFMGKILEIVNLCVKGAESKQIERCMDILVKEGKVERFSKEYYELLGKMK